MAVTTVTPVSLVKDAASVTKAITAGTAINASNTMSIAYPTEGKLLLVLNNTYAGAKSVTVASGEFGVAKGQGNLAVSLGQDEVKYLVVSSDRFKDFDGNISLSFESSMTGYVLAFYIP